MASPTTQQIFALAQQHQQAGRMPEAETLFRQVAVREPNNAVVHRNLGLTLIAMDRVNDAIVEFRRAIILKPGYAQAHTNLGNALRRKGLIAEALDEFRRAVDVDSQRPESLSNLGNMLQEQKQYTEAISFYQRAISIKPDYAQAHGNLGNALHALGRFEDAASEFQKAISIDRNYAEAYSNLGNTLTAMKRYEQSITAARQAIALRPGCVEAFIHLGHALRGAGQLDEAVAAYRQAVLLAPDQAEFHCMLGNALKANGQTDEAIAADQRAIEIKPDYAEAWNNLGSALIAGKELTEAIAACRQAISIRPDFAEAFNNLGSALISSGNLDYAITACRQAISLDPDLAEAWNNLGSALCRKELIDEALSACRQAIAINPELAEAYVNLGSALIGHEQLDQAITACRRAIALNPRLPEAWNNLASALIDTDHIEESITAAQQAIALNPNMTEAWNNLGNVRKNQGNLDEAIGHFREAIRRNPTKPSFHSNLVLAMHYQPDCDSNAIAAELRNWNHQHAEPLARFIQPHLNDRDPNRRLRIGYVSPDFRDHVVGRNLLPLFSHHDRSRFEIFCYGQTVREDDVTRQFQSHANGWRNTVGISDERMANEIRDDRIDILVDLALHTAGNRLLVFARKPAPVQCSFAGYPGSTGVGAIDYRVSDPYLDPPEAEDADCCEKVIRLRDSFWCYDPLDCRDIHVAPLPAVNNGILTFGCLNNFCKINNRVLDLWAAVLREVRHSRLLMLSPPGDHRADVLDYLDQNGVAENRVEFVPKLTREKYLQAYNRIDIGLDTFPYNGHTTSLDSLWMGVPVVSLVGAVPVSRAGFCQLSNLGLPELAVRTPEQFVRIAADLAGDLSRLKQLRETLRQRMQQSPLMDAPKFAASIETAYRQMWTDWCAKPEIHRF